MLKLTIVFFFFSFFSLAFADVTLDEIIKNNIIEENNTASEVQQFAGIQSEVQTPVKTADNSKKKTDFKVVLRKKSEKKNPVVQRLVASKSIRVTKVTKKRKRKN